MTTDNKTLFQETYRVPTTRVDWHDYNNGVYHIVLCEKSRAHVFGHVMGNDDSVQMQLSAFGVFVDDCIKALSQHYAGVQVPVYQIMPDHIHLILDLRAYQKYPTSRDERTASSQKIASSPNTKMQHISQRQSNLSRIIGQLKGVIKKYANRNNIPFDWESRYYDTLVHQNNFSEIADYITHNVQKWAMDKGTCTSTSTCRDECTASSPNTNHNDN